MVKINHNTLNIDYKEGERSGTLVFIHGNSSSLRAVDHFFDLPHNEYNLLRLDLPGHGDSFRSDDPVDYSFSSYQKQIKEVIGQLDGDICLIGHSMGGHLAIEMAPEISNLQGLLICGAPPIKKPINVEEAFLPFPYIQNMFVEEVSVETAQTMFSLACVNQEAVDVIIDDFYRCDPKIRSAMAADIASGELPDERQIYQQLETKKYILNPLQDPSPNMDYIRSIAGNAEIIDIPDCGHYPSIERPEIFNEILNRVSREVFN